MNGELGGRLREALAPSASDNQRRTITDFEAIVKACAARFKGRSEKPTVAEVQRFLHDGTFTLHGKELKGAAGVDVEFFPGLSRKANPGVDDLESAF